MKTIASLLLTLFLLALPQLARASEMEEGFEDDFAESAISTQELDTMRGGAINIRGVMFDFSYLANIRIMNDLNNINNVQNLAVTAADIQSGIKLPDVIVISNTLDNTTVNVQQLLDMTTQGMQQHLQTVQLSNRIDSARQFR